MNVTDILLGSAPDLGAIAVLAYWLKSLLGRIERRLEKLESEFQDDQVDASGRIAGLKATVKAHGEKFSELDKRMGRVEFRGGAGNR